MLLKPFLNNFCSVAGCVIMMKDATVKVCVVCIVMSIVNRQNFSQYTEDDKKWA